jgi:class 3 adenylate cyclase
LKVGAGIGSATGERDDVNVHMSLVSRLEGLCRPLGKDVLVSGTFAAETGVSLIPLGTHALRGIASPCAVFHRAGGVSGSSQTVQF